MKVAKGIGPDARILFGAVLTADGGPVEIGAGCIVMENAVLRGTRQDPLRLGRHVLVGPLAYLTGCAHPHFLWNCLGHASAQIHSDWLDG